MEVGSCPGSKIRINLMNSLTRRHFFNPLFSNRLHQVKVLILLNSFQGGPVPNSNVAVAVLLPLYHIRLA
jgi:hypothetical protein